MSEVSVHPRRPARWVIIGLGVTAAVAVLWSLLTVLNVRSDGPLWSSVTSDMADWDLVALNDMPGATGGQRHDEILSLTDADYYNGVWYLLDRRARMVHRVDTSGAYIGGFGGAGQGPGEFAAPEALRIRHDTVMVAGGPGGILHAFDVDGGHLYDRQLREGCSGPGLQGFDFIPDGLVTLWVCVGDEGLEARVAVESGSGSSRVLATRSMLSSRGRDPFFFPVVAVTEEGILFGLVRDECLESFSHGGVPTASVCHTDIPRLPLSDADRRSVEELRTRGPNMNFEMPRDSPPFDGIFVDEGGSLIYRGTVPGRSHERHLLKISDGGSLESFGFSAPFLFVRKGRVVAGWDEVEGVRLAFLSLRDGGQ